MKLKYKLDQLSAQRFVLFSIQYGVHCVSFVKIKTCATFISIEFSVPKLTAQPTNPNVSTRAQKHLTRVCT